MFTALPYSKHTVFSILLFLVSGILAIVQHEWFFVLIPFAWLILPMVTSFAIRNTEQVFWLLLFLLPLSTEINITPQLGLDFPDEILMVVLTGLALLHWWHQPRHFPIVVWRSPLFFIIVLHLCWIGITAIYAVEPLLAVKFLLAKIWYIIPFVILPSIWLNTVTRIQRSAYLLLIPMGIVAVLALFRHASDGFSFESINRHLFPFFRNHVNYAAMLVCLLAVAVCMYTLTPTQQRYRTWLLAAIVVGVIALLLSYSRGAWLAAIAGCITVFVIKKKWMNALIVAAISMVLVSTIWLVTDKRYFRFAPDHDRTIFHTDFSQHLSATLELKDVSNAERFYRWVAGARMFAEKPITGFGPASFYNQYKPYTVSRFETWVSNNPEHSTVHNYFLLTALEQGVVGLIIFCLLYFGMLARLQKLYHQLHNQFYRSIAILLSVVLVMIGVINFMSDMIETDKIGTLFWLCAGMLIVLEGKLYEERQSLA